MAFDPSNCSCSHWYISNLTPLKTLLAFSEYRFVFGGNGRLFIIFSIHSLAKVRIYQRHKKQLNIGDVFLTEVSISFDLPPGKSNSSRKIYLLRSLFCGGGEIRTRDAI